MIGVDDLLDIALDALTHEPGAPHAQPLFLARVAGERVTTLVIGEQSNLIGARQVIDIEDLGRFSILVEECGT